MKKIIIAVLVILLFSCTNDTEDDSKNFVIEISQEDPKSGSKINKSNETIDVYYKVDYSITEEIFEDSLFHINLIYKINDGKDYSWHTEMLDKYSGEVNAVFSIGEKINSMLKGDTIFFSSTITIKSPGYVSTQEHADYIYYILK